MARVTFLTDMGDVYEKEHPQSKLVDHGPYTAYVEFYSQDAWPKAVIGTHASSMQFWEIVVTDDGQTMAGPIEKAEGMTVRFYKDA